MNENELAAYVLLKAAAGDSPEDYAYVPDREHPTTWKLNISDATHVGGAVAALGPGYRGEKVSIPSDALAGVKRKVLAAWKKFHPDASPEDVPEVLKKGMLMTNEEMTSQIQELSGKLDVTEKRADRAEQIIKLNAEERTVFDSLDAARQDEYLKADATARKAFTPTKEGEGADDPVQKKLDAMQVEFQKQLDTVKKDADERIAKAEGIAKAERDAREKTEFMKRAEGELENYPGTIEEKGSLLQALHNGVSKLLTKEQVEGIAKLLASGKEALAKSMKPIGKDYTGTGTSDPEQQMEALVTKHMSENKGMTRSKAYLEVAKANPELYERLDARQTKQ